MNWKNINANKNVILSIFFGIISGIKEHSVLWGLLILVLGFAIFNLMDLDACSSRGRFAR